MYERTRAVRIEAVRNSNRQSSVVKSMQTQSASVILEADQLAGQTETQANGGAVGAQCLGLQCIQSSCPLLGPLGCGIRHNHHYQLKAQHGRRSGKDPRWIHVKVAKSFSRLAFVLLTSRRLFPHPDCQPRHSIFEKLLAFHTEHRTDMRLAMQDLDQAAQQVPARLRNEETQLLQRLLDEPESRRRRGPVALAKILPVVLARLGMRTLQSEPEVQDPS